MDIYVAGKTDDWERVRQVQQMCERLGHNITYDWTKTVEEVGPDEGLTASEEFRCECAEYDRQGTRASDLLIMLCYPGLCGTLIECGMAIGLGIPVLVLGEPERNSVFFSLRDVTQADTDAINDLGTLDALIKTVGSKHVR